MNANNNSNHSIELKTVIRKIVLLMEHQHIVSDIQEIIATMKLNCHNDDYLKGAQDALSILFSDLSQKGE